MAADAITGSIEQPSITSRLGIAKPQDVIADAQKETAETFEHEEATHRCYRELTRIAADAALLRGDRDNYNNLTTLANEAAAKSNSEAAQVFLADYDLTSDKDPIGDMEKTIDALARLFDKGGDFERLSEDDTNAIMTMLTRAAKVFDELCRMDIRNIKKQEARFSHEISKSVEAFEERQKRSVLQDLWPW
jgi:adenosine deaminase